MRRAALLVLVFATPSCFRLSDPFYVQKPLRAPEPSHPAESLLFGTIEFEGNWFTASDLHSVWFNRVAPESNQPYSFVTRGTLFRVFQDRPIKDGHFVISLLPGMYELERLESFGWLFSSATVWKPTKDLREASRIYVTRPGIYDIGCFKIENSKMSRARCSDPNRSDIIKNALLAGTRWQGL